MKIGIVGLPNAGKSTIFNALTEGKAKVEKFPFTTIEPNIGKVKVPDERLEKLEDFLKVEEGINAEIEFVDIAGLIEGASKGEGMGNQFLSYIQDVEVILHIVRGFEEPDIPHSGELELKKDIEIVNTELLLKDLEILQKAASKLKAKEDLAKKEFLLKVIDGLQRGIPVRDIQLNEDEKKLLEGYKLLTFKPVIYLVNLGEGKRMEDFSIKEKGLSLLYVYGKIEEEISKLPEEERKEFREIMGVKESGLKKLVKICYDMLDLITFYTIAKNKLRAWALKKGEYAIKAAEEIHSDIAKGFIKAEVINFKDLITMKSYSEAKEKGKVKIVGKEYPMNDGDVIYIHFRE